MINEDYIQQAKEALEFCKAKIDIAYSGYAYNRNWGDEEKRDFYDVTITTPIGSMNFDFWQSIYHTEIHHMTVEQWARKHRLDPYSYPDKDKAKRQLIEAKKRCIPTVYDVLACLTKYDPGTFDEFCSDFGYDNDSRRVERIYFSVVEEYQNMKRIFTEPQLEKLRELQ